jgi:TolB-like protein/DNA-binding SARP family transcriptional activator
MDTALGKGIEGPARWSLRLLGGFELSTLLGGERVALPGKRERVLLAYLALSPNCRQQRRKLATLLWGDASDETALDNLRTCVWALRKALGDTDHRAIASEGEDIVLDAEAFDVDALAFRRLAAQSGRTELEAAANYSGEFLDGLDIENDEFQSWRRTEGTQYREQAIDVLSRLMTQLGECGETERAIETGLRILRLEPVHEPVVRRLMRLYGESGRRGAAIQLYRTLSDALKTEFDARPEAETRAVYAGIARGEEQTGAPALPAPPAASAALSGSIMQRGDSAGEPLKLPMRPAYQLRAPLAIIAGVLLVAVALISYRELAPSGTRQTVVAERAASASEASAVSIAVLPFVNLSGDASQEFFSDGMTEEITSALAKVPNLRVVGRTSAFQFKGQNQDLRAIARSLAATHLIEGSVRKAGDRLRVTVQLIKADDGTHTWSEDYDRRLTDIFAVQEDIAQAIAAALRVPLGLKPGTLLVSNRTISPDSYQAYLHAKALVRTRQAMQASDAVSLLEEITARAPNYAPAWALLSLAYDVTPQTPAWYSGAVAETRRLADDSLPKAEAAAQRAIQLDPDLADGYASLGRLQVRRERLLLAEDSYSKALALDPNNPDALQLYGNMLAEVGYLKQSLVVMQRLRSVEPFVPILNLNAAVVLWLNGRNGEATGVMEGVPPVAAGEVDLAQMYASVGNYRAAADQLLKIPAGTFFPGILPEAIRLLRGTPAPDVSTQGTPGLGRVGFVYLYAGAPIRALEFHEAGVESGYVIAITTAELWHPSYAKLRKTERFKSLVRKAGLVDYWRAKDWPALCHPTTADDFACE